MLYLYVGQEENGSSYVLFPYPEKTGGSKYSPCRGITCHPLFQKINQWKQTRSEQRLARGKEALDGEINAAISRSSQSMYAGKVNQALQKIMIRSASFSNTNDGQLYFKVDANDNKAEAAIVSFDK
ncbi:MAG: hypothetical protein ABW007_22035 [Chitinophagaceae bacterium]